MSYVAEVIEIIRDTLVLGDAANDFTEETQLLGGLPEFDSMAVVTLITALEEEYGFCVDDDEINADVFETVGSLVQLVEEKIG